MKRIGNLFDKIVSEENIYNAYLKARKGKRNTKGVIAFEKDIEGNIKRLSEQLKAGEFKTSPYREFTLYDPKERNISVLPFYPDRLVHHSIMTYISPILISTFTADTYNCIKGRGVHKAVYKLKDYLRDVPNTLYCLKLDITKFYPSIKGETLKSQLRRKLKDERVLNLLDEIIDSKIGQPIGNFTSQTLANYHLSFFDHWMKEQKKVKYYMRYADDLIILHSDKEYLHNMLQEIKEYLRDNLELEVKGNHQVFPVSARGIDFLGYKFYHTHTRLRKRIKNKMKLAKGRQSIMSYRGWALHADSQNLLKNLWERNKTSIFVV